VISPTVLGVLSVPKYGILRFHWSIYLHMHVYVIIVLGYKHWQLIKVKSSGEVSLFRQTRCQNCCLSISILVVL